MKTDSLGIHQEEPDHITGQFITYTALQSFSYQPADIVDALLPLMLPEQESICVSARLDCIAGPSGKCYDSQTTPNCAFIASEIGS
jgi:hypothetical protein